MQWEELTAPEFAKAVHETGVCVIALGVIERHSDHLPLGTDYLVGHKIACLAAEKEPAVVFPPFYFGQIYEARCFPGTITIEPALLVKLIQGVFDEIGRNGFQKIVALNAHGGNNHLLGFLAQASLWEEKPYCVYMPTEPLTPQRQEAWERLRETTYGGHSCEQETSAVFGVRPDLVKMERVPEEPARPLGRLVHLPPTYTGIWWYADYPDHYAGDARAATQEKGQALIQMEADTLAEYIAAVKADTVVPTLNAEFFRREEQLRERSGQDWEV
jgi:creatinine amidohydrolase